MKLKNVSSMKCAHIVLSNMNLFYGKNGSGKTYTSYIIYGISKYIENMDWKIKTDELFERTSILKFDDGNIILNWNELYHFFVEIIFDEVNKYSKEIIRKTFNKDMKNMDFELEKEDLCFFSSALLIGNVPKGGLARRKGSKYNYVITHEVKGNNIIFKQNEMPSYISDNFKETDAYSSLEDFILNDVHYMNNKEFYKEVKEYILHIIDSMLKHSLYIPAERQGINIFHDNLVGGFFYNSHKISFDDDNSDDFDDKYHHQKYSQPLPIVDYINYVTKIKENNKSDKEVQLSSCMKKILKGNFKVLEDGDIIFVIGDDKEIPLDLSSSSVKSLFGLHMLDRNRDNIIIVDEPELNLTPENQKLIAEYLYFLSVRGNKVVVSTHSDYIVKTFAIHSLKEYLSNRHENNIKVFSFDGNEIHTEDELWKLDEIPNFDDTYNQLMKEYAFLEAELYED